MGPGSSRSGPRMDHSARPLAAFERHVARRCRAKRRRRAAHTESLGGWNTRVAKLGNLAAQVDTLRYVSAG